MAAVCGLFLLAAQCCYGLVIIADADHDCQGADCQICLEIQACIGSAQSLGSAPISGEVVVPSAVVEDFRFWGETARRIPAITLHALDVRFDE